MLLFFLGGRVHLSTPIYLPNLHMYLYSCQGILNFKKTSFLSTTIREFRPCLFTYLRNILLQNASFEEGAKKKKRNKFLSAWMEKFEEKNEALIMESDL